MSTAAWFGDPVTDRYRDLLDDAVKGASPEAPEDRIDHVLSQARRQLALRDALSLGFGGLVAVLLSFLRTVVRHLLRRNARTQPPNPK